MATTHVFIVDVNTFKYHIECMFAGTGAGESLIDFNDASSSSLHHSTENNLVGMIADFQRVRKGDYAIFYLQQSFSSGIYEGKFYGIFKIKDDLSFLDHYDSEQFLYNVLRKSLTFRTLLIPHEIYAKGVTEWEALDQIKYIQSPHQMLWSLIYRKLKGNRGNTMITIYESERLLKLIRDKNNRQKIVSEYFTFNISTQQIEADNTYHPYTGRMDKINILPRLSWKHQNNKAFEVHLQAYITENIGRQTNQTLDEFIIGDMELEWIGNEVSCGVGMQRIDVMLSVLEKDDRRIIIPIELKAVEGSVDNIIQLQRYVDWLEQYYLPNRISDIQPILISKFIHNKGSISVGKLFDSFKYFNSKNENCLPLKYIEYYLDNNNLIFEQHNYN